MAKCQTLFSNKVKAKPAIKLIENDEIIDNEIKIAKIFSEYFVNIFKKLGILTEKESATFIENNLSEVEMALKKYKSRPSANVSTERYMMIQHDDTTKELNK